MRPPSVEKGGGGGREELPQIFLLAPELLSDFDFRRAPTKKEKAWQSGAYFCFESFNCDGG